MNKQKQQEEMRLLGKAIEETLKDIYEVDMGFFLCVAPLNATGANADYISNAQREDACAWMIETTARLSNSAYVPKKKVKINAT